MEDLLLEPLQYYEAYGRQEFKKNAIGHFDSLLKTSEIDLEANRSTVEKYDNENKIIDKLKQQISAKKLWRALLITGIFAGIILVVLAFTEELIYLLPIGVFLIILGFGLIFGKLNKDIARVSATKDEHIAKASEYLREANEQMAPLNALFDDLDTFRLIEKTIPDFTFDERFSKDREEFLIRMHDFIDLNNDKSSVTNTLSGSFRGNPFVIFRRYICEMSAETYHGSLTISWTETYRDSNGNLQTRTRTQTLHASVTKPKPIYYFKNQLGYGCQAAPDLSFSRTPKHSERLSESALERKVRRGGRKLQRRTQKATNTGSGFQEMANTEFEVLLGATDRNHEVQFRLMYTPLAQKNTVALLTSRTGYGDDFYFNKCCRYNIITCEHMQNTDLRTDASIYRSHSADLARLKFLDFTTNYFKSIFFAFAPLFAIPAYMEEPCASMEPIDDYLSNYTYYEHEIMANLIGEAHFAPADAATGVILKSHHSSKQGNTDRVTVTAHSYSAHSRVDYVPVLGGDGHYHNVPVYWTEYLPTSASGSMLVGDAAKSSQSFASTDACYHGLKAKTIY